MSTTCHGDHVNAFPDSWSFFGSIDNSGEIPAQPAEPPVTSKIKSAATAEPARIIQPAAATVRAEMDRVRKKMPNILSEAEEKVNCGTFPLRSWGIARSRIGSVQIALPEKPWFIIGDLHGDFVAWYHLFERIQKEPDFRVLFLGDLVDRGPHSLECVAALFEAILKHPKRFLWIMGNHDEALSVDKATGNFRTSVEPAEFLEELKRPTAWATQEQLDRWGKLFINVAQRLPRAVVFSDGLLATHGGIPLSDHWDRLKSIEAFHTEQCLRDFTWTRAANKPRSLFDIDRRRMGSSDFQYGFKDMDDFCAKCGVLFNKTQIKRVVRGHDHVEHGVDKPSGFVKTPLLTINGFGFNYLTNDPMNYRAKLALGVYRNGETPTIEDIPLEGAAYEYLSDTMTMQVTTPEKMNIETIVNIANTNIS